MIIFSGSHNNENCFSTGIYDDAQSVEYPIEQLSMLDYSAYTTDIIELTCPNKKKCRGKTCKIEIQSCNVVTDCEESGNRISYQCTLNINCVTRKDGQVTRDITPFCPIGQVVYMSTGKCGPSRPRKLLYFI